MQTHGNRRLFDLSQSNQQRLRLAQLRRESSITVRGLWDAKPLLFHPNTPALITEAFTWCNALHQQASQPHRQSTALLRTSSPERAYAWLLAECLALPAGEYVASFGSRTLLRFDSLVRCIPDLPVTRVTSEEIVLVLKAERKLPFEELALVAMSGPAKLVLDSYVGTLAHEPHPNEAIYELARARSDA